MTASVLCPETQTSTHPFHCSSTHWLHLIDSPTPPTHPSGFAQLSKQTSLLSCRPGAHRCSAWTAGGVLACGWLTVFNSSAETSSTLVDASPRTHFNSIFTTRHSATRGSECERRCRFLSSSGSVITPLREEEQRHPPSQSSNSSALCFSSPIAPPVRHCYVVLTLHLCSFVQFLLLPATNVLFCFVFFKCEFEGWGLHSVHVNKPCL